MMLLLNAELVAGKIHFGLRMVKDLGRRKGSIGSLQEKFHRIRL